MDWYAIYVKTGEEEIVQKWFKKYFDKNIFNSIIPKKRISEKRQGVESYTHKKLFPGYILINTIMSNEIYYRIKSVPNYIKILGSEGFEKIPLKEMEVIISLIDENETLDLSKVYIENSSVKVVSGPLKGKEAIIKKVDKRKKRAKILLDFRGEQKIVDVGIEVLN